MSTRSVKCVSEALVAQLLPRLCAGPLTPPPFLSGGPCCCCWAAAMGLNAAAPVGGGGRAFGRK